MKTEGGGGRVCLLLLLGMNDWVGVDPLGSAAAVEAGGDGGGRGLLLTTNGGVNGRGTEAGGLLGTWFWAGKNRVRVKNH